MSNINKILEEPYLYRFRPAKSLLEFKELEKQCFYFATPEELNDPNEGLRSVIWRGDTIVWQNFIKHYIHCFSEVFMKSFERFYLPIINYRIYTLDEWMAETNNIHPNDLNLSCKIIVFDINNHVIHFKDTHTNFVNNISIHDIQVTSKEQLEQYLQENLPVLSSWGICSHLEKNDILFIPNERPHLNEFYEDLYDCFLSLPIVTKFLEIRHNEYTSNKEELRNHLLILNKYAIHTTTTMLKKHNLCPSETTVLEITKDYDDNAMYLMSLPKDDIHIFAANSVFDSVAINDLLTSRKCMQLIKFLQFDFASHYIEVLTENMFSEWGIVCFSKNSSNIAMWGYYADSHKGVTLKFKAYEDNSIVHMDLYEPSMSSLQGILHDFKNNHFYQVGYGYSEGNCDINFFEFIGNISERDACKWWYDGNNQLSSYASHLKETTIWHSLYYQHFINSTTVKHLNWNHENEIRLINNSTSCPVTQYRFKHYKFNDLDGIIFGINTSEIDKKKIIDIIKQKCKSIYEQVCDVVNNSYELDYEVLIDLQRILNSQTEIYMPLAQNFSEQFGQISTGKLTSDTVHILGNHLINSESFKKISSAKRRNVFNFYQAYYCNKENIIKHKPMYIKFD